MKPVEKSRSPYPRNLLGTFVSLRRQELYGDDLHAVRLISRISEHEWRQLESGRRILEEADLVRLSVVLETPAPLLTVMSDHCTNFYSNQFADLLTRTFPQRARDVQLHLIYLSRRGFQKTAPEGSMVYPELGLWVVYNTLYRIGTSGGDPRYHLSQELLGVYDQREIEHLQNALGVWKQLHCCEHERL